MNISKWTSIVAFLFIIPLAIPHTADAQWGVGASYELRDEDPQNGFGLRLERSILNSLPVVDVGLRAHFSYFSEENQISDGGVTYDQNINDYDLGIAAYGGISLGLVKPYVGLGLGSETWDVSYEDRPTGGPNEESDSKLQWNSFIGAQVAALPYLKPFIEYRYTGIPKAEEMPDQNERLIIGLKLEF
jgi:opacity protein-like surface antigen